MMYHVSWGHLRYLLTCKVLGKTRVMTEKCFLWRTRVVYLVARPSVLRGLRLDGVSCILTWFPCKSLGETRVTTRKSFMWRTCVVYLIVRPSVGRGLRLDDDSCTCTIHLLLRPWVRRELRLEKCFWWRTCVVHLIVRPSVGRGSRLDDVSCFWSNYRFLITCKVLGGARATTRKCFWWKTCVVYLIVRDVSCILVGQLAFFTHL